MNMSMKKNRSFSSSRIALMALGISVLTACGGQSGQMGDNEFTVKEITATSSNQVTKYPATIKGLQDIEIRPQVSGFIVKLCVDEGATVRKGQALFQIDPTQYQAAFDQAAAGVESAKANLKTLTETEANKKMLHEQKIISDFEYQTAVNNLLTAKANLAQAEASYTAAKQNLGFCTVTSPSDGVIGTFPYRIGALVSASIAEPLTTVSQIGDMYVYFSLTERPDYRFGKYACHFPEQAEYSAKRRYGECHLPLHHGKRVAGSAVGYGRYPGQEVRLRIAAGQHREVHGNPNLELERRQELHCA